MTAAPPGLRTVSYGGGVQSTALLVLAAAGRIDFPTFLFANVGDDSEHPGTLEYVRGVAMPYAQAHGIDMQELHRVKRDGAHETLWGRLMRPGSRSLPIPVRMSNGAPGTRACTADFKIKVLARWLKAHGATPERPATVAVGISLDEFHRAHNRKEIPYERVVYPLLDARIDRSRCLTLIRAAGLPVPPKSACFFCPFHRPSTWAEMARDEPDLFDRSVLLERTLNARRGALGKDPVFLTRFNAPLDEAVHAAQDMLPMADDGEVTCDNGACWT